MRIALITGSSSGIGKWLALYTAQSNLFHVDEVWMVGRKFERLYKVAKKIGNAAGVPPCRLIQADLTRREDLEYIEKLLIRQEPEIRLLINCAGCGMIGDFKYIPMRDSCEMIRLNCEAPTLLTKICLPYMQRGSSIINVASSAAFTPQSDFAVYGATKSYLFSFSKALGKNLKKLGISVTAVCPGYVDTPFYNRAERIQKMKWHKKLFAASPKDVARQAILDAARGKRLSVCGFPIKCYYWFGKLMPDAVLRLFY